MIQDLCEVGGGLNVFCLCLFVCGFLLVADEARCGYRLYLTVVDEAENLINPDVAALLPEGFAKAEWISDGRYHFTSLETNKVEFEVSFPEETRVVGIVVPGGSFSYDVIICWNDDGTATAKVLGPPSTNVVPEGYGFKSMVGERIQVEENQVKNSGAKLFYASVNKNNDDNR